MEQQRSNQRPLVGKLTGVGNRVLSLDPIFLWGAVVVVAGIATGVVLSNITQKGLSFGGGKVNVAPGAKVGRQEAGLEDTATFRDEAEGKLEKGGIDGEGSYHLERPGGPSQNVYLTSSIIDLDDFVGKNVHVWGETHKGQKAGWLMDVGKIKIIE